MHILVIGGTRFTGRHFVALAAAAGHSLTVFHRGLSAPGGPKNARSIIGDRAHDIQAADGVWDAVVDMCGMLPRDVRRSAGLIAKRNPSAAYVFISSVSAYTDRCPPDSDESGPLHEDGDPNASAMTLETYGALKVQCERVVQSAFPNTATIIRPGLIVGPHDPSDRFTYWVRRCAQGGPMLAPGTPLADIQVIDARDLAQWILRCVEHGHRGTFNATGPAHDATMGDFIAACIDAAHSDCRPQWVPEAFLLENKVEAWTDMPLWIQSDEVNGLDSIDSRKAVAHGLRYRPLRETVHDTLAWDRTRDWSLPMKAGITREREAELLAAYERSKPGANAWYFTSEAPK